MNETTEKDKKQSGPDMAEAPAPKAVTEQPPKRGTATFSKEKLLRMERYAERRDLLAVLLRDGQLYTLAEVKALIEKFMKGKVK